MIEINEKLLKKLDEFHRAYPVDEAVKYRITKPSMSFIGKEVLEMAVSALLEGENLLLCGDKATGKNILAENLAWMFGRPVYNMSFHVNTDSSSLTEFAHQKFLGLFREHLVALSHQDV